MQLYYQESEVNAWKQEIQAYHKNRKELGYKQEDKNIISHRIVKRKEREFDPVLQIYADKERDTKEREMRQSKYKDQQQKQKIIKDNYMYNYDIVTTKKIENNQNLRHKPDFDEERKKKMMFKRLNKSESEDNRIHKKLTEYSTKYRNREFNVVSNMYCKDHESTQKKEYQEVRQKLEQKKNKVQNYNLVTASFYNQEKENKFQQERKEIAKQHGKDFNRRFPPSWKYKEMIILDQTKPIPMELQIVDQRKEIAQRPYRLKHELDKEYRERGMLEQDMQKNKTLGRFNQTKYVEEYTKGYNLVTNQVVNKRTLGNERVWDKIQRQSNQSMISRQNSVETFNQMSDTKSSKFRIKTGGFN